MHEKMNLVGLSREELGLELAGIGELPFRTKQLWHWIYNRGVTDFAVMSSIAGSLREKLASRYEIARPAVIDEQQSSDRSRKWLLEFADGARIETVFIPEEDRGAVCISSQVGCAMNCGFCRTGSQGLTRSLSVYEIVSQYMVARDHTGEWPTRTDENRLLSNIVFMGMGEPLLNYDNLVSAIRILNDGEGLCISKRKITVSTCGIVPFIPKLARDLPGVKLALSLHAANDETRSRIMPINRKYPLQELMAACREYQQLLEQGRQYITMEYVMLDGINDSVKDAEDLIRITKGMKIKVNIIPFNEWEGSEFKCSPQNRIDEFAGILEKHHIPAPVRVSRGQDILAACGQLKSAADNLYRPS